MGASMFRTSMYSNIVALVTRIGGGSSRKALAREDLFRRLTALPPHESPLGFRRCIGRTSGHRQSRRSTHVAGRAGC